MPEALASFPATLVFSEVDYATLRLDGLAGIPVPAAAGTAPDHPARPRHPFSMVVEAPAGSWLAAALVTLDRGAATGAGLVVEVVRRGARCQATFSDGTACARFDVRGVDGLFWLRIGGAA